MNTASIVIYKHDWNELQSLIYSIVDCNLIIKLFIIDNSPNEEFGKNVNIDRVEYIFNKSNIGFGAAHNVAINKAIQENSSFHFVINPDIYFDKGTVEKIANFMDQNPNIGLLMPQIRNTDGSIQYLPKLIPSPFDLLVRRLSWLRKIFTKRLVEYELRRFSDSETFHAPIISGCFSCFRLEAIKKVGLYDERFFMYFEDFDLSRRMNKYYDTVYYSEVHVFHEYERGAQKSSKLFRIFIESAIRYFRKWGWFFDRERKRVNKKTLAQFNL